MTIKSARFVSRLTAGTVALVLAGGRGSRLKMLTVWRAKPAVPFGGKFRIIDFALSNCVNSGIRRISVLTQYKSHSLIRHIQRGWNTLRMEMGEFVELLPAQQWAEDNSWFAGTADAVYQSLDIIESHRPDYVLILAGDHVYQMDYGEMLAAHVSAEAQLTIACIAVPRSEASAFGVMTLGENHSIIDFEEKPGDPASLPEDPDRALVSMGIYVFSLDYLAGQLQRDAGLAESRHDFGRDIIPHAIAQGHRVQAYPFDDQVTGSNAYWRDVGTIDAYYKANMELLGPSPVMDLYGPHWRIRTYQEQLPPAKFIGFEDDHYGIAGNTMVSGGCVIRESHIERSLLFSNVRVGAHCELSGVLALPRCEIGKGARLRRVLLDNGCKVPPGTVIGENPEEDAERYYCTPEGVVVVNREMLGQARRYLPTGAR
ncbi:MAG: glucose-1-phosphate adenylyltransferase [Gammaproteobacteria bacterium]